MTGPSHSSLRNRLLRALPPDDYLSLQPLLEPVEMRKGDIVIRPNQPFDYCYFPESGLSSVLSSQNDAKLEVGLCGREGMVSTSLVLGVDHTPHETVVQGGGTWLRLSAGALTETIRQRPQLRDMLMRYVHVFLLTISQTALSNGAYKAEERLARWLLLAHDRVDGDDLPLTHEFLSLMLGLHRPGVTVAIHILEGAGMIRARRGAITVLDRAKLKEAAGDSYGVAEAEYERLIGPYRQGSQ